MVICVTGGAGYIGSHAVKCLQENGMDVIVIDNLSKGHRASVDPSVPFYSGDVRDSVFLHTVFSEHKIDAVIHFAADSLVGESVYEPIKYYQNNVVGALTLLEVMREFDIKSFIFSSTAATYGEPVSIPILEEDPTFPTSPYGESKLAIEKLLKWSDRAYGIKSVVLRYFNVAGAHPSALIGEDHQPESHLIPLILKVALGKSSSIKIFGTDYPTLDGTCIRDYIHVCDLAQAHVLALKKLLETKESKTYNLGNGKGFSVNEVITMARKVTGHPIPAEIVERRAGDPAILLASSDKAVTELKWQPQYNELSTIIESAWAFHQSHPDGYQDQ
jgi:UDP-glucose 4-epimerase